MLYPADCDALCAAILDLGRDSSVRAEMREKSLARAAHFTWERCTRETLAAFRAALAE